MSKEQLIGLYESRGRTLQVMMEYEKAGDDFQSEIELIRELGDKNKEAQAMINLAWCYGIGGGLVDMKKARECFDQSLKLIKDTGDAAAEVRWNIMAGFQMVWTGLIAEGGAHLQQAVDMCRKFENKRGLAPAVGFLGAAHILLGDFNSAITEVKE